MRRLMPRRRLEIAKSVILVVLVVTSLLLGFELWWRPAPITSLPPALIGTDERNLRETLPPSLVEPVSFVYHGGDGTHRSAPMEKASEASALLDMVLSVLRPGDLNLGSVDEAEHHLRRYQMDRVGVSIFLAGRVPLSLLMGLAGAVGEFPDSPTDRMLFSLSGEDPSMLYLHIPTEDGLYHTRWTVVDDFDESLEEGLSLGDLDPVYDETLIVALWARMLLESADAVGESMVLVLGWRDMVLTPLLSIPEVDLQVSTQLAASVMERGTERVMSFFSDFTSVRHRREPDGSTTYTDGYRSVRLNPDGSLSYNLIIPPAPEADVDESEPGLDGLLCEAWTFLRTGLGEAAEELLLVGADPLFARGTLDLDEGRPAVEGYRFHFAQRFGADLLVYPGGPVSVVVDGHGVRNAEMAPLRRTAEVQWVPAITPISALEHVHQYISSEIDTTGLPIERVHLVKYPAHDSGGEWVVRPAWYVDMGAAGLFMVDAVSGDIVDIETRDP